MKTIQPLDSYRLAQYAVPMPCFICGEGNTFDSDLCRHCSAPMALARQAAAQKIQPQMIGVLGAGGAGKTVFLGMLLDMLSRLPERLQVLARGDIFNHAATKRRACIVARRLSGKNSR